MLDLHNVFFAPLAAEDSCGGRLVQSGGGRQPPAGVRAQSRRAGGRDPAASDWRRHPAQCRPKHDLKLSQLLKQLAVYGRPGANSTTVFKYLDGAQ